MADERVSAASVAQAASEQQVKEAYKDYAEKERAYRKGLARRILELKAESVAITAAADIARGDEHVANLRYERDVAQGVMEAARMTSFRHSADRRELEQLIQWSMKLDPILRGTDPEPEEGTVFGRRFGGY